MHIYGNKKYIAGPQVIYEDNHLLVLEKPPGMPSVPDASRDLSLLDWGRTYLKHTRNKPGNVFLAVIHRIDRPVSGLVCFAVTSKAASRLSAQLREHRIGKRYLAVSAGRPLERSGKIENYLRKDRERNVVERAETSQEGAQSAVTRWQMLQCRKDLCLFALEPVTGRSHQLRVHMAGMKCPIFGDRKYGSRDRFLSGRAIALHSFRLSLEHPTRKEMMEFESLPPKCFPYSIFSRYVYRFHDKLN